MADQQSGDRPAAGARDEKPAPRAPDKTRIDGGSSTVGAPARWSGAAAVPPPAPQKPRWPRRFDRTERAVDATAVDPDDWSSIPAVDPWAGQDDGWDLTPFAADPQLPPTRVDAPSPPAFSPPPAPPVAPQKTAAPPKAASAAPPLAAAPPPLAAAPPPLTAAPRWPWARRSKQPAASPVNRLPVQPRPAPQQPPTAQATRSPAQQPSAQASGRPPMPPTAPPSARSAGPLAGRLTGPLVGRLAGRPPTSPAGRPTTSPAGRPPVRPTAAPAANGHPVVNRPPWAPQKPQNPERPWAQRQGERPPTPRRRRRGRRIALGLLGLVLFGGLLAYYRYPAARQYPVTAALPPSFADLTRRDDDTSRAAVDRLTKQLDGADPSTVFAGVYGDSHGKRVTIFGVTGWRFNPGGDVQAQLDRVTDDFGLGTIRSYDAGEPGVHESCGVGRSGGAAVVVCAWADHGSLATVLLTRRSLGDSADLVTRLRDAVLVPAT